MKRMQRMEKKKWLPAAVSTAFVTSAILSSGVSAFAHDLDKNDKMNINVQADEQNQVTSNTNDSKADTHGKNVAGEATSIKKQSEIKEKESAASQAKDISSTDDKKTAADQKSTTVKNPTATEQSNPQSIPGKDAPTDQKGTTDSSSVAKTNTQPKVSASEQQENWIENAYKKVITDYELLIDDYQKYISNLLNANQKTTKQAPATAADKANSTVAAVPTDAKDTVASATYKANSTVSTPSAAKDAVSTAADKTNSTVAAVPTDAKDTVASATYKANSTVAAVPTDAKDAVSTTADKAGSVQSFNPVYDKLVGYFQQVLSGFQSFISLLK